MKVLFFTRLFYPHVGGIEKHLEKVSEILIAKGYQITLLTTRHDNSLPVNEIYKKIQIVRFKQPQIKYFGLIYTWLWLLKNSNLIKQSDIIHVHDVFIWYWPFRFLFPKKKVFITFHGQWGKYPIPFIDKLQKKIGAKFSDRVISIGNYIDKNYGIKSNYISYGGVTSPLRSSVVKEDLLLYVGRLDKNTGLPSLLESLKSYGKEAIAIKQEIIFCGDGELKSECAKYGKVVGWTDSLPYYKKARFVFASGYLTILEALANKCLVFAGFTNPLQKDYYTLAPFSKFIVTCASPKELSEKILYYVRNNKEYSDKVDKGYKWVKTQTWDKLTDIYLEMWSSNI